MIRFRSLATGVAVMALLATSVAWAQGPRGGGPFGGRGGPGRWAGPRPAAGALNLTEAQREEVRGIGIAIASRRRRWPSDWRGGRQAASGHRDPARQRNPHHFRDAGHDAGAGRSGLQEARLNAEIWSVLTPEQQAQMTKLRAERKARLEERRQEIQQRRQNRSRILPTGRGASAPLSSPSLRRLPGELALEVGQVPLDPRCRVPVARLGWDIRAEPLAAGSSDSASTK